MTVVFRWMRFAYPPYRSNPLCHCEEVRRSNLNYTNQPSAKTKWCSEDTANLIWIPAFAGMTSGFNLQLRAEWRLFRWMRFAYPPYRSNTLCHCEETRRSNLNNTNQLSAKTKWCSGDTANLIWIPAFAGMTVVFRWMRFAYPPYRSNPLCHCEEVRRSNLRLRAEWQRIW